MGVQLCGLLQDNNAAYVTPYNILGELCADHQQPTRFLRATHAVYDEYYDVATARLRETWIDEIIKTAAQEQDAVQVPQLILGKIRHQLDGASSARTQSLSQTEKPALEMRETRSLGHLSHSSPSIPGSGC
jgi:hypothetical protein